MLNIFKHNILITVMSVVAFVCMLICWACPLDVYNSKFCKGFYLEDDNGYAWKSFTDLSAGFVLMVVASGLQLINILVGFERDLHIYNDYFILSFIVSFIIYYLLFPSCLLFRSSSSPLFVFSYALRHTATTVEKDHLKIDICLFVCVCVLGGGVDS
eukprot:gene1190-707_t